MHCGLRRCEVYDDRGDCIYVGMQDWVQLCSGEVPGLGSVRSLGGDDDRLAVPGGLLCGTVCAREVEAAEDIESAEII